MTNPSPTDESKVEQDRIAELDEQVRNGFLMMLAFRDLLRANRDACYARYVAACAVTPPRHPALAILADWLRDADETLAQVEAQFRMVRAMQKVQRELDARREAVRAAIEATATAPLAVRARVLRAARGELEAIRHTGATVFRPPGGRKQRDRRPAANRLAICPLARRTPRARARRRQGARRLTRAPASDGESSSDPPPRAATGRRDSRLDRAALAGGAS